MKKKLTKPELIKELQKIKRENRRIKMRFHNAHIDMTKVKEKLKVAKEYRDDRKLLFGIAVSERNERLAEIDRLRQPVAAITEGPIVSENITIDQRFMFEKEIRELRERLNKYERCLDADGLPKEGFLRSQENRIKDLSEKLEVAEEALDDISSIGHVDCQWCRAHEKTAEDALAKIRGDNVKS